MYSALTSAYVAYWYQYGAMLPPYREGMTWKDLKKEKVSASYTLRVAGELTGGKRSCNR